MNAWQTNPKGRLRGGYMSWIPHFLLAMGLRYARWGSAKMPSKYIFSGRNGLPILPKGKKLLSYFIEIWHYYFISLRIQPLLCHGFPQRFEFSSFANSLGDGSNEGRLYSLAMKLLTILPTNYNFFKAFLTTGIEIYILLALFILFKLVTEFDYRFTVVSPTSGLANVLFAHIKVVSPTY